VVRGASAVSVRVLELAESVLCHDLCENELRDED